MDELKAMRSEIDEIDEKLLDLYARRIDVARRIGEYKKARGMQVFDPEREKLLLAEKVERVRGTGLESGATRFFELLMSHSRHEQHLLMGPGIHQDYSAYRSAMEAMRDPIADPAVVYQGQPGAYGEEASISFFGEAVRKANVTTFEDVFKALDRGEADYGVLPIENNSTGSIVQVFDLMTRYNCYMVGEKTIKVGHCLMAPEGADLGSITDVYSHEQGFLQSEGFLSRHPSWRRNIMENTAESAKRVSESKDTSKAAIASRRAADIYGLKVLSEGINSNEHNNTRFVIVSKAMETRNGSDKISVMFTLRHEVGSLHRMLSCFTSRGLNLLKIESRPVSGKGWEYRFFTDFTGSLAYGNMDDVVAELIENSESFRILGSYKSDGGPEKA